MSNNRTSGSSITIGGLLQLTFIILKLCGVINWSWVWVLSPLWIGAIIAVLCATVLVLLVRRLDS